MTPLAPRPKRSRLLMLLPVSLLALACLGFVPSLAAADPAAPNEVASELLRGRLLAPAARRAWEASGTDPLAALNLLREARLPAGPGGAQQFTLRDGHERETTVLLRVPAAPRADGRYGVLVMLHGLGGDASQLLPFAERIAPPGTIVVAPNAQRLPPELENVDVPKMGRLSVFPHWWRYHSEGFVIAALEEVQRRYPVDADRVILSGYSMGGYGTWNLGLRFSGRFAAVAPFAGGIARSEMLWARHEPSRALLRNARGLPLFFVHGNNDQTVPVRFSRSISSELEALEVPHVFREVERGGHILMPFLNGNALTDELSGWLAQQARSPWPRVIERAVIALDHGRDRWLRVDALSAERGLIRADVQGQVISLRGEGVSAATLFLDPSLIDPTRSLRVEWNGILVHEGPIGASWEALEASLAAGDPATAAAYQLQVKLPELF